MIHEIWLFLSGTGLPLWSKQFGRVKNTLDPTLIAGLLTAIKGFSNQAIGSDLKDIVLEEDRLHNFLVSDKVLFTIHIDERVPIDKVDQLLNETKNELLKISSEAGLSLLDIEKLSFKNFQKLVELITPTLEKLALKIDNLRNELLIIHDEKSFNLAQLTFLSKIPELVPQLTKHHLSLTVKDLKTNKIHFQQTSEVEYNKSTSILEVMNYFEHQDFFLKDLETIPSLIFISNAVVSAFKIPQVDNLILIFKDHIDVDDLPQFRKLIVDFKKKITDFYK